MPAELVGEDDPVAVGELGSEAAGVCEAVLLGEAVELGEVVVLGEAVATDVPPSGDEDVVAVDVAVGSGDAVVSSAGIGADSRTARIGCIW